MKKSRPIFYPEFDDVKNNAERVDNKWQDIRPSQRLKIGRPSSLYFQHIYPSLNFKEHSINNFKEMLKFEGMEVFVTSILKMKNGESYAVLDRKENVFFSKNISRIYAEVEKSFLSNEIVNNF